MQILLILVVVSDIWLGAHLRRTQVQRDGVAAIREYGGWVSYDYQFPMGGYFSRDFDVKAESRVPRVLLERLGVDFFHDVVRVDLRHSISRPRLVNKNSSDLALQDLPCFPNLRYLHLTGTQARDDSLQYVGKIKRLEVLNMWFAAEVSDEGVAHLRNLRRLRFVDLRGSRITDKSLEVFATMTRLEKLRLNASQISDAGLAHLVGLKRLEQLELRGLRERPNMITDDGISQLHGLKKLKQLDVKYSQVTEEGVAAFERAVPGCHVSWSRKSPPRR